MWAKFGECKIPTGVPKMWGFKFYFASDVGYFLSSLFQGPSNPNIFEARGDSDQTKNIAEDVIKESKIIQDEIIFLLNRVNNTNGLKVIIN